MLICVDSKDFMSYDSRLATLNSSLYNLTRFYLTLPVVVYIDLIYFLASESDRKSISLFPCLSSSLLLMCPLHSQTHHGIFA